MTERVSAIYEGDCLEYMRGLADKSVDVVITDPPYSERLHKAPRVSADAPRYGSDLTHMRRGQTAMFGK